MTNKNPSHLPRSAHSPFPCPFCGEKTGQGPTLALGPNVEWISKDKRRAGCGCGARGPIKDNDVEAIDSWNCIVSSVNAHASLVERVKELDGALREALDLFEMQEREGRETFSPDGILPKLRALAALGRAK